MPAVLETPTMAQELNRPYMRARRKELGLSQSEAAEAAGFSGGASYWSDIESDTGRRGNVTIDTLARIAAALECDARDLLTEQKPARTRRGT